MFIIMMWVQSFSFYHRILNPSQPLLSQKIKVTRNEGKSGEIWGLGEREGFTKSPPIPKPLGGRNTPEVNNA
jgi:hypothetical protein